MFRVSLSIVAIILMFFGKQGFAASVLLPDEHSAVNDPLISSAWLEKSGESWLLRLEAEFANVCLADGGIEVSYFDLQTSPHANEKRERLFMVHQQRVAEGCPDIFRPVTQYFVAYLPKDLVRKQWLVSDTSQTGVRVLGVNSELDPESSADAKEYRSVNAQRLPDLPKLTNIRVSSTRRYERPGLQYKVLFEFACGDSQSAVANILESRTGISDQDRRPVTDWLWIQRKKKGSCAKAVGTEHTKHRFEIQRQVRTDYARRLIVINPVLGHESNLGPFTVYDVWPENGT